MPGRRATKRKSRAGVIRAIHAAIEDPLSALVA
jgi:hypothetical protein